MGVGNGPYILGGLKRLRRCNVLGRHCMRGTVVTVRRLMKEVVYRMKVVDLYEALIAAHVLAGEPTEQRLRRKILPSIDVFYPPSPGSAFKDRLYQRAQPVARASQ